MWWIKVFNKCKNLFFVWRHNYILILLRPMKLFAVIMSLILFAQIFIPCADSRFTAAKEKTQLTQASNHQTDNNQDMCTPLCSCNCCGHSASSISFITSSLKNSFSSLSHVAEFLPLQIKKIALPIWQPPKL